MFEVGKHYRIRTTEPSAEGWTDQGATYTVGEVNGTLVRLQSGRGRDLILNTASWHFHSAEEVPPPNRDQVGKWEDMLKKDV